MCASVGGARGRERIWCEASENVQYSGKLIDFGSDVCTILENEFTSVQKCILFSEVD